MELQRFKVKFVGVKPLLMHNPQMANPLNSYARELKKYSSKRNKTEEDHIAMSNIEFIASCYFDKEIGFYIPSENIEACITTGAKVSKKGKTIPLAVTVEEFKVPLIHRATAKDQQELFEEDEFQDVRFVTVNRAKILRTRPRFDQWSVEFTVKLDTTLLDTHEFIQVLNDAGQRAGLGDYRPKYGIFEVSVEQIS